MPEGRSNHYHVYQNKIGRIALGSKLTSAGLLRQPTCDIKDGDDVIFPFAIAVAVAVADADTAERCCGKGSLVMWVDTRASRKQ